MPDLGGVSERGPGKNFDLVRKYECRRSVLETDEVHVAIEIVYFPDYLDGLGEADMPLVISHRFQQSAIFPFWVIGAGVGSGGFHRFLLTSSGF